MKYTNNFGGLPICVVALFTRAWIEMLVLPCILVMYVVALFTRAWIEINVAPVEILSIFSRPLHEGVD